MAGDGQVLITRDSVAMKFAFWATAALATEQIPLMENGWSLKISKDWDVLGPFPIHAREQHFLSPSFPLDLSKPIDFNQSWTSSYADGVSVSWTTAQSDNDGNLKVSYPGIRWEALRATEGWAALQHHNVLITSITIYPPKETTSPDNLQPHLLVNLVQGSYFTILPSGDALATPEWHSGNIYDMERAISRAVNLPTPPSTTEPTKYDLLVSGDYEIRLFGDPHAYKSETPVLSLRLVVDLELPVQKVVRETSHDVVSDFIDGFSFGKALGIGLRSVSGWWTVQGVKLIGDPGNGLHVELVRKTALGPSQARIVPIRIAQTTSYSLPELQLELTLLSDLSSTQVIPIVLLLKHHQLWTNDAPTQIRSTYFYSNSIPTVFVTVPPEEPSLQGPCPPILALHGAGLDILSRPMWADALPRQRYSWTIIPAGRTSWGLDWHGSSTKDAWGSLDAVVEILEDNPAWHPWRMERNTRAIVIGHSNGGQGAWYVASRFPDRVIAVVPAAGYIKSQAYVPLTQSRSAHFIDPALGAILETSLTPDNNDLFLSNLESVPVFAIHGGDDDNVPTWHSRELISALKTWYPEANATYKEYPGKPHWWPTVVNTEEARAFIAVATKESPCTSPLKKLPESFTLTVSSPRDSGTLHGFSINALITPGRLARLNVENREDFVFVTPSNVQNFSIHERWTNVKGLYINDEEVKLEGRLLGTLQFSFSDKGVFNVVDTAASIQPPGRIQSILTSSAPLTLVIPDNSESSREFSVALRIAHDLDTFHKLDSEITFSSDVLRRYKVIDDIPEGNIVVINVGRPSSFLEWVLAQRKTPFELEGTSFKINGRKFSAPSTGVLFMHPHPTDIKGSILILSGTDTSGLERAARLFPIRTGVTVPDWLAIGERADHVGAAGILGAGVWGRNWTWSEAMSWLF